VGSPRGAPLLAHIKDGLTREGAGTGWSMFVIGCIIVGAVAVDNAVRRHVGRSAVKPAQREGSGT
jgi:ribose/xylose/arabinose/galactoside ABC-type transport system permease subunit